MWDIPLTGRCRICRSVDGQAVTRRMIEGKRYREIMAEFPDLQLSKQILSRHRAHFVVPDTTDKKADDLSDHGAIDLLRAVGVTLLRKVEAGEELSSVQAKIVTEMVRGILGRRNIEDSQAQMAAFLELLEQASKSVWKHEAEAGDEGKKSEEVCG